MVVSCPRSAIATYEHRKSRPSLARRSEGVTPELIAPHLQRRFAHLKKDRSADFYHSTLRFERLPRLMAPGMSGSRR